jgi:DNA-binding MarR family transcriptional regulator
VKIMLKELVGRLMKLGLLRRLAIQEATADIGLYFGQLPILEYLMDHDQCTQKEIADQIKVTPASVAISTKRMQKAGLLEKTAAADNLRCNRLTVTAKGRELSQRFRSKFDETDQKMFAGFTEAELDRLRDYLDRLIMNISNETADENGMDNLAALKEKIKDKERRPARSGRGQRP